MEIFMLFIMLVCELCAACLRWAFPSICIGVILALSGRLDLARDPGLLTLAVSWGFRLLYWGFYIHAGLIVFRLVAPAWQRFCMGLRKPSHRELVTLHLAYSELEDCALRTGIKFKYPSTFLVRDTPQMGISLIGQRLVIDRGLIGSPLLVPLLADELGHYNSSDCIVRFLLLLFPPMGCSLGCFIGLALGFSTLLTAPAWRIYWRKRYFAADTFASQLGQRDALIEYLEIYRLPLDHATEMAKLFRKEPYVEQRIDHLSGLIGLTI